MSGNDVAQQRADLLRRSREEHARLEAILATLTDEQMLEPGVTEDDWSVKDHLAHLTWWEQRVVRVLARGEPDPLDSMPVDIQDTDAINAHVYAHNRDRPLAEVRSAFDASYQEMLNLIETVPDDLPAQQWGWIEGNAAGHYEEHRVMFEAWQGRRRTSPPAQP